MMSCNRNDAEQSVRECTASRAFASASMPPRRSGSLTDRAGRLIAALVVALVFEAGVAAAPALASSVTSLSAVSLSSSAAAATGVRWSSGFTTSSAGGLSSNGTVTVVTPSGTVLPNCVSYDDTTTNQQFSGCQQTSSDGGATATYGVNGTINAGDQVKLTMDNVTNPPAGTGDKLTFSTSSDTTPASTPTFATTAPQALSDLLAVSLSSSAAGATGVTYSVGFTTSSTGGLVSGGSVTVVAPSGTVLPNCVSYDDTTTNQQFSGCQQTSSDGGATATYGVNGTINAGDQVKLTMDNVTNPPAGTGDKLTLSTSSDTTPASTPTFATTAPQALTSLSAVSLSSSAAAATGVRWSSGFTTSSAGGLSSNGTVTVVTPSGTVLPNCVSYDDTTTNQQFSGCQQTSSDGGATATYGVNGTINAGDQVKLTMDNVTNPPAGTGDKLTFSTSSDTTPASTPTFATTAPQALSDLLAVSLSSSAAGATGVTYSVGFTTSSTGGLVSGGSVTVVAPSGTVLPNCVSYDDTTTNQQFSGCQQTSSDGGATATYGVNGTINAGDQVKLTMDNVTNPPAGTGDKLTLSTSSDTTPASTPTFATTAPQALSDLLAVSLSSSAAGATGVTYSVGFTTSSTGGLVADHGTVSVAAPEGTVLPECVSYEDKTTGGSFNGCQTPASPGGASAIYYARGTINAGDQVTTTFDDVTNPPQGTGNKLTLSTSSDTTPAATPSYTILRSSTISGSVVDAQGTGVPDAAVQACPASGGSCYGARAGEFGLFQLTVVVPETYTLSARADAGDGTAAPVVATGSPITGVSIQVATTPMPTGITIAGQSSGVPSLYWADPVPITVRGCPHGLGVVRLTAVDPNTGQQYTYEAMLTETSPGSGLYTGTLPPTQPAHGEATVETGFYCMTALFPKAGPSAGGNVVRIHGSHFTGATRVMFGSTPAPSFTVASDSEIIAVAPPGTGTVAMSVTTASGTTQSAPDATYSYFTITSLSASSGPAAGGTRIAIHGTGLDNADTIVFSGKLVTALTRVSDTELDVTAPPGSGTTDVAAVALGESTADATHGAITFTYQGAVSQTASSKSGPIHPANSGADGRELAPPGAPTHTADGNRQAGTDTEDPIFGDFGWDVMEDATFWAVSAIAIGQVSGAILGGSLVAASLPAVVAAGLVAGVAMAVAGLILGNHMKKQFSAYIDPSGAVVDTNGNPIPGATVTMLRGPTEDGPFAAVASSDPGIRPNINPEVTGSDGAFHWDVFSGYYQLTASAPGCTAPGDPDSLTATSAVLAVPPPQVGLLLTLACPNQPPPPQPDVTGITVASGPAAGGSSVVITGSGFTPSAAVSFGQTAATSVSFLSPDSLSAIAPSGSGTVDVTVATNGGTSARSSADQYTYHQLPAVAEVSPNYGTTAGGDTITITGTGFTDATSVSFGGTAAGFTVISDSKITAIAPAEAEETVDVSVQSLYGTSRTGSADRFTAFAQPTGTTNQATAISDTAATVNGTLNPQGAAVTDCHFEYGATTFYGQTAPCSATPSGNADAPVSAKLTGLASATEYHVQLVAITAGGALNGGDQTFTTTSGPLPKPMATTGPASGVGQTAATLNATVNPHGVAVSDCHFDYGTTLAYGSRVPCTFGPSGSADTRVTGVLSGLHPATQYHYRVVLTTQGGTATGQDATLTTQALAPTASTRAASGVGQTAATLNATVNPHGVAVSDCHFDYGTTLAYGSRIPCTLGPSGSADTRVTGVLSGLHPATQYHYRVVLTTQGGTATGQDATLTTQPGPRSPVLSALRLSPPKFLAASSGAGISANARAVGGTTISYRDTQAALSTFTIAQAISGVIKGSKCVAPPRSPATGKTRRCVGYVTLGTFSWHDKAGRNSFHFSGRFKGHKLAPGTYRLTDVARNTAGEPSNPVSGRFTIARPKTKRQ